MSVPDNRYNNCSSPMIHDGDESSEVEKVDDSKMARNFKTLDEGMGSGNGMTREVSLGVCWVGSAGSSPI